MLDMNIYIYVYFYIYIRKCACMSVCLSVCLHVCICIYACMHVWIKTAHAHEHVGSRLICDHEQVTCTELRHTHRCVCAAWACQMKLRECRHTCVLYCTHEQLTQKLHLHPYSHTCVWLNYVEFLPAAHSGWMIRSAWPVCEARNPIVRSITYVLNRSSRSIRLKAPTQLHKNLGTQDAAALLSRRDLWGLSGLRISATYLPYVLGETQEAAPYATCTRHTCCGTADQDK